MKTKDLKSAKDYINAYTNKGFTKHFMVKNNSLIDLKSKTTYNNTDVFIVAKHRFEGLSNPDDLSILYIVETSGQGKGCILVNYSAKGNTEAAEFFKTIPKSNSSDCENIIGFKK